jgi:hypothetical protein
MKQAGGVRLWVIVACVLLLGIIGLAVSAGPSATSTAEDFMRALQAGDVDRLTELSYVPAGHEAEIRKQWDFCVHKATPYYNFLWNVTFAKQISDDEYVVSLKVIKNATSPSAYDEPFEMPLERVGRGWKVDVYRLSSKFYPGLPREGWDVE